MRDLVRISILRTSILSIGIYLFATTAYATDLSWIDGTWVGDYPAYKMANNLSETVFEPADEARIKAYATQTTLIFKDNTVTSIIDGLDDLTSTFSIHVIEKNRWRLYFSEFETSDQLWATKNGFCILTDPFWVNIELTEQDKTEIRKAIGDDAHLPPEGWIEVTPSSPFCYKRKEEDLESN